MSFKLTPKSNIPRLKITVNPYIALSYQKHVHDYARDNYKIPLDYSPRSVYLTPNSPVLTEEGNVLYRVSSDGSATFAKMYEVLDDPELLQALYGENYVPPTYYYPPEESYYFLPWSVILAEYNTSALPTSNVEETLLLSPQGTTQALARQLQPRTTTSKPKASTPTERLVSAYQLNDSNGARYTIKKGDNLWNLAKLYLGSGAKYTEIMKANGWTNSNLLIRPGDVIIIPGTLSTSVPQRPSNRVIALRDYKAPSVIDLIKPIAAIPNIKKIKF